MKRFLGLLISFICFFGITICAEIDTVYQSITSLIPFIGNFLNAIKDFYVNFANLFSGIHFDFIKDGLTGNQFHPLVYATLIFLGYTIVYLIIFGIIAYIQKVNRKKRLRKALQSQQISLTEEEKAKFDWKLYERKFPGWRLFFLLIEVAILAFLFIVRYDEVFNGNELGKSWFGDVVDTNYENNILHLDYFSSIAGGFNNIAYHIARIVGWYIENIANKFFTSSVLEISIFVLCSILVLSILWLIGTIPSSIYRKHRSKVRARKAKQKYVKKLEDAEYKAWVKSKKENRISEKNRTLYNDNVIETEVNNHVDVIAENTIKELKKDERHGQSPEQNYIDDISTGVTDLGVIEEDNNELQKPLLARETRFVGEEETDIILEEEPVIETIEEDESYYNDLADDKEETFEKYQPETALSIDLEDKVKKYNIDVIEENSEVNHYVEEENLPVIQDYEDHEILMSTIKKEQKPYVKPLMIAKKNIKPVEAKVDKKGNDYIINNYNNSLSMSEEERNIEPKHIVRKPSALTKRNNLQAKKTIVKMTSAKKLAMEKPTKPLDIKVE